MLKTTGHIVIAVFGFCIASVYFVCQAQGPVAEKANVPLPSMVTAGSVAQLRDMAGDVTVTLIQAANSRGAGATVTGQLVGLDEDWVVVRLGAELHWIPVSNVERMIQRPIRPEQ